jgi:putative tryptophan/tyrosine transport system substrate-binding protein
MIPSGVKQMTFGIGRRRFMTALGATVAWPLAARAQQPAMPVIGFLGSALPDEFSTRLRAFREGLKEAGYVEGQNVAIEYRWADGQYDRLPMLASELVERRVTVIAATGGDVSALAAKAATTTIPIVFDTSSDPVKIGLVASLNRPGGNLTGVSIFTVELVPKRLELLCEVVPTATVIGLLVNPMRASAESETRGAEAAVSALGRRSAILYASSKHDLGAAFATLGQQQVGALLINGDNLFISLRDQLAALTARYAVPTMYGERQYAVAGGLMSYNSNLTDTYRQVGVYTGKILQGEKPADLPIQQPTKFDPVINLKTAGTLGLTIPPTLLARADEVIE